MTIYYKTPGYKTGVTNNNTGSNMGSTSTSKYGASSGASKYITRSATPTKNKGTAIIKTSKAMFMTDSKQPAESGFNPKKYLEAAGMWKEDKRKKKERIERKKKEKEAK